MDRKREIIVIDDGITSGLFGIGNLSVNLEVTKSGRVRKRVDLAGEGRITHGSICAAIIKKYAPGAVVGSIKVLDEDTNTGTCEQLVKALQWCLSKRIKIIHMSIGTIRQEDFGQITQIVNQLAGQGSIIVAACNNNDIYTIPACLPNVIGVKQLVGLTGREFIINNGYMEEADFFASGIHRLDGEMYFACKRCNSYAAPVMTAQVFCILQEQALTDIGEVRAALLKKAENRREQICQNASLRPDFLGKCIAIGSMKQITRKNLHCSVIRSYRFDDIKNINLKKRCGVLFLPQAGISMDSKEILLFLRRNKAYISGVVYAGYMPVNCNFFCREGTHFQFWDQRCCERWYFSRRFSTSTLRVPIISLEGNYKQILRMAVKLREILLLESCRTWIISDRPYCYLYGVDFFDTHLMDERVLVKYSEYHNLDFLILCGYEENRQINKDFQVYMRDGRKVLQENTKFYPVQGLKELGEVLLSNMGIKQDNRWDRREI